MNTMWKLLLLLCCWWLAGGWATATTPPSKTPLKCNKCQTPSCEVTEVIQCPMELPICATIAYSPDFQSELTCAKQMPICQFSYKDDKFMLLCACDRQKCNTVFSTWVRNLLVNLELVYGNDTDVTLAALTQMLVEVATLTNTNVTKLYELAVGRVMPGVPDDGPHFEALIDDDADDDEPEGSGAGTGPGPHDLLPPPRALAPPGPRAAAAAATAVALIGHALI